MATYSTTVKQFIVTATKDADFRAIIAIWRAAFAAFGLVQLGDSGQVNPSTVTFPASNNVDAGFEIWRFDDTLQSTVPVHFKISYGRGNDANSWRVVLSVAVGTSTDGASNFIGILSVGVGWSASNVGTRTVSDTTAYRVYGSGGTNRFVMAWFPDVVSSPWGGVISLERTKASDGTDTGDGIMAIRMYGQATASSQHTLLMWPNMFYTPVWASFSNRYPGHLWANGQVFGATPRAEIENTSTLADGKVYAVPFFPQRPGWKYPLMNVLLNSMNDFPSDFSTVSIPFYGSNRTYLPLSALGGCCNMGGSGGGNQGTLIRYE